MRKIPVGKKHFALVDDGDYEWASQYRWRILKGRHTTYARRNRKQGESGPHTLLLHREIMQRAGAWCSGLDIDHMDGNGLNNCRKNLRSATRSQNQANRGFSRNHVSGFKGVTACQGKWRARIGKAGRNVHLGHFLTKEDAARAYDRAAIEIYGEYARLNFPKKKAA